MYSIYEYWIKKRTYIIPWIVGTWCTGGGCPWGCSPSWSRDADPSPWTQTPDTDPKYMNSFLGLF